MRLLRQLICLNAALLLGLLCYGQRRRDPLNPQEIDQLRDAAQDPEQRLKLYVEFARARLSSLEQMRADPKTTERARKTHDDLEDFVAVYDELNDNVDTFADRQDDIRKPLKAVIEADTEFQARLRALENAAKAKPEEVKQYDFVLSDAIENVDRSAEDHRKALAEQEEAAKKKKLRKPDQPVPTKSSFRPDSILLLPAPGSSHPRPC